MSCSFPLVHFLSIYKEVCDLHRNRHPALFDGAKHHVLELGAAGLVHRDDGDACNVVETENVRQLHGNIKVVFRAADQRNTSLGQRVMEARIGKCRAVRRNEQMSVMIVRRELRRFVELDRPLHQVAAFLKQSFGVELTNSFPRVKILVDNSVPPQRM